MMQSFKTALTIATVIGIAFAAPRSDDMNNEIIPSGGSVTKNGESVSASWGGFHASASLSDDGSAVASAGGNGLGADAGYGAGGAGAGAGVFGAGSSSSAEAPSAGVPSKPSAGAGYGHGGKPGSAGGSLLYNQGGGPGNGFFDKIFAIPINVLQSVNTYLNQKQMQQGHQGTVDGHNHNSAGAGASASAAVGGDATYGNSASGADKVPGAAGADYGHGAAGAGHGKSPMMIPITALRSVQNLLNG